MNINIQNSPMRAQYQLEDAILAEDIPAVLEAFAAGATPNGADRWNGLPPLHIATFNVKKLDIVRILVNRGADVEKRDYNGVTALYYAFVKNQPEIAKELLESGADLHSAKGANKHASMDALTSFSRTSGHEELAAVLESYSTERPSVKLSGRTKNLKEKLMSANKHGHTPLDNIATWQQFDEVSAELLQQNTPITKEEWFERNSQGERWIDVAVKFRAVDKVLGHMQAQGGAQLTVDDLVNDPSLLEHICSKGGVKHLFTPEFLQAEGMEGMEGMKRLQEHIPENAKADITNRFALTAWLQVHDQQKAQGQGQGR